MSDAPERRSRIPLVPRLFLGALAILLLSWLAFMVHYVRKVASQPRGGEAPPRVAPAAPERTP